MGAALLGAGLILLTACTPGTGDAPDTGENGRPSASAPASVDPDPRSTPAPTSTPVALPTDCKTILSGDVLAQLKDVPLNDPALGESGVLDDGTLLCVWADPHADTTGLTTRIERMPRGEALDMLSSLAEEGFSCYTPDGGTRCEKTWKSEQYPVTDGRTLFWRDDVLIDTNYSNLAPQGYTASIVAAIWG
ncbi:hypothetical protein GCM10025863_19870 [Microbacterium suwonense]|uniref:DUF3558 domain-containing protein n=1 Tax=Microbacterium suwonense TaxID=683047 RepID=A0ABM8FUL3_9MICO|nr:hypothetical protein GCM10025863_19870 [Microbacterium suwonense]